MILFNALLTIILIVINVEAIEYKNDDKRRLPDNFRQYKWTTTTAVPDEVYIEPLQDVRELCIQMLEKYRYGDGDYVWRPYNSRFYGELRWKRKN